ncbi:MAG: Crp/Fnr family transcriptional regulator [Methylovirgula sp.]
MALDLFNYENPQADILGHDFAILKDLSEAEWTDFLKFVERQFVSAGVRILTAGDSDRSLYLIAKGAVDVIVDVPGGSKLLATIGEGSVFGEMAFFDGKPRSAHIVAREDVEILSLGIDRFEQLAAWRPRVAQRLLLDLGRVLSLRLRRLNTAQ